MRLLRGRILFFAGILAVAFLVSCSVLAVEKFDSDFVFSACDELEAKYYDPAALNYPKLLNVGLEGIAELLKSRNVEFQFEKISESADKATAKNNFRKKFERAKFLVKDSKEFGHHDLYFTATAYLLDSLKSSHTYFLNPEVNRKFISVFENQERFVGIGIVISKLEDGFIYISRALSGFPAEKSGLRDFDRLIAVDGQPISNDLDEIVSEIRGVLNTEVIITVERGGSDRLNIKIKRSVILTTMFEGRLIGGGDKKIGQLILYSFNKDSASRIQDYIADHPEINGWILDLRGNSGGSIFEVRSLLGSFLPSGAAMFITKSRLDSQTDINNDDPLTTQPLVVLIDNGSASGSEITAGALKDNGRAAIVGVKSVGKTEVGEYTRFFHGSAIVIAVKSVFTPKENAIEGVGISPDVEVKLTKEDIVQGKDRQLEKAIEILKNKI